MTSCLEAPSHSYTGSLSKPKQMQLVMQQKKKNFNSYRNVLCKTIAFTKRKYYIHIFEQCQRGMKKTWATLSEILNKNAKKSLPGTMTLNGPDCKDKQIISEQFNSFFATIGKLNKRNINCHLDWKPHLNSIGI